MNRTTALRRKLVYLVILVGMLVPLYLLGQPAGGGGDTGGRLAEMRVNFNIAESDLGEISPASETMKLASLGLRGVAATLLWNKAHHYRVTHEFDRLKATLNNIALLQPHYDKVWEHQAHNLAYNVSIEFDDYRQRYEMVREGTEFLTRGVRQNRNAPRLIWYTGWFYGQKMGMSDEKRQFRRLFADDEVLHESLMNEGIAVDSPEARGPLGKPDNWLVGRLWLRRGYDLVDTGVKIRRQTPLNFYETGPKWRIQHAEAIEKEGILDDRAQSAWQFAEKDWIGFGNRSVPTTARFTIKLDQLDELIRQREETAADFRELTSETYDKIAAENVDSLPEDLKKVYAKAPEDRTEAGKAAMAQIEKMLVPSIDDVAKQSDSSVRLRAISMIAEMAEIDERINKTRGYRTQINYPFWKTLTQAEQEERTVRARRLIYEAEAAHAEGELDKAITLYEQSFAIWAEIFDDYPVLTIDDTADELTDSIRRYMVAIDSEDLPEAFPLFAFARMLMENDGGGTPALYAQYRATQADKAAARRKELEEEEERRLEEESKKEAAEKEEVDKDDAKEKASSEDATDDKDAAEKETDESDSADEAEKSDATESDASESSDTEAADSADDAPASESDQSATEDEPGDESK